MTVGTDLASGYELLRTRAGLVDRSERGKLALTGSQAKEFLHGQVSQDVVSLTPGHGAYAALLTNKGKMRGDLRVLDTGEELLLDTERIALQELFNTIRSFSIGWDVQLHKRTLERALLSLVGPEAEALLRTAAPAADLPGPTEHDHREATLAGTPVRVIRTDAGLDLLLDSADRDAVHAALVHGGAVPVDPDAAEILRVESGRPRYGIDLDDSVIPQEAGLNDRAVSFTKGCYVGQETVARLFYRGKPNRELRGLRLEAPAAPGAELTYEDKPVGSLTSVVDSPRLGPIALGFVRREVPLGARVEVSGDGVTTAAAVVALPFG